MPDTKHLAKTQKLENLVHLGGELAEHKPPTPVTRYLEELGKGADPGGGKIGKFTTAEYELGIPALNTLQYLPMKIIRVIGVKIPAKMYHEPILKGIEPGEFNGDSPLLGIPPVHTRIICHDPSFSALSSVDLAY
jgi:hypothetical protein